MSIDRVAWFHGCLNDEKTSQIRGGHEKCRVLDTVTNPCSFQEPNSLGARDWRMEVIAQEPAATAMTLVIEHRPLLGVLLIFEDETSEQYTFNQSLLNVCTSIGT
jgi:hypothetical protein